jgi:hypothetical protein
MNDLDEIRALFPEQPPPSEQLVADVRARLADAPRATSRRVRLLVPLAAGATAVAVAVAVGVVVARPDNVSPPASEQTEAPPNPNILLRAADRLAEQAGETGRFWRIRYLRGDYERDGGKSGPVEDFTEVWLSGDGHEPDWEGHLDQRLSPPGEVVQRDQALPPDGPRVRDLPTEAAELRTSLLDQWTGPSTEQAALDRYLFVDAVWLLVAYPAPPKTQAAALRLIAGLGVVQDTGPVTDSLGRKGTSVTFSWVDHDPKDITYTTELIFDQNGTLLTVRYSGPKNYYVAVVSEGWTDETPSIPSPEIP